MKFYIDEQGDPSVGIFPTIHTVEIDTNIVFDEDFIGAIKDSLRELFDVRERDIYTQEEWDRLNEGLRQMERDMDQAEEEWEAIKGSLEEVERLRLEELDIEGEPI